MSDELKEALSAIGAIAEIAGFIREQLVKNGFTVEEAYTIAHDYVLGHLGVGG